MVLITELVEFDSDASDRTDESGDEEVVEDAMDDTQANRYRQMHLSMRPRIRMEYTPDIPFLDTTKQYTRERGFEEPVITMFEAQKAQQEADEIIRERLLADIRRQGQEQMENNRNPQEMQDRVHEEYANLHLDLGGEITYERTEPEDWREYLDREEQDRRRDGLIDMEEAFSKCPICRFHFSPQKEREGASLREQFVRLYHSYLFGNQKVMYSELLRFWNTKIAPLSAIRPRASTLIRFGEQEQPTGRELPMMTESHIKMHFRDCGPVNIVETLRRQKFILNIAIETYVKGGLVTEQCYNGRRSGKMALGSNGGKVLDSLFKQEREVDRQLYGIQLYLEQKSGSDRLLSPYYQTAYKPPSATQIQKQMEKSDSVRRKTGMENMRSFATAPTSRSQVDPRKRQRTALPFPIR